ncbi:hypothetical protein [Thermocatellispora tengchongensis]|uniref:hypothetical protein n=1 Tax=Thermocatellispora tengchongensis TaxID=1073253 RepID=UPI00363B5489
MVADEPIGWVPQKCLEPKISPRQAFAPARPNLWAALQSDASQPSLIPSRAAVLSAVPAGMRRAPSQQDFRRAVKEHPDAFALKCHAYRNLTEVADALANWADWTTMTTRPTEQRIADDLDLALSTVKRWIRWLRERGFLGVVEEGTTNRYRRGNRCGLGDDGLGNRAAVWVLCVPAPELDEHDARTDKTTTEPPPVLPVGEYRKVLRARARKDHLPAAGTESRRRANSPPRRGPADTSESRPFRSPRRSTTRAPRCAGCRPGTSGT